MPGVYISYPFCAQKCTYCNFASGVFSSELEGGYIEALSAEISATTWPWRPDSVYLPGGTPSRMDAGDLDRILAATPARPCGQASYRAAAVGIARDRGREQY